MRAAAWVCTVAAALAGGAAPSVAALEVARGGRARVAILVADDSTPAERNAARDLAEHLRRITDATFPVRPEPARPAATPALYVGPTRFAAEHGIGCGDLGPEEWVVETARDGLILCGGRPRGTLYAVYRFLEDHLGVRWWTPFEDHVPRRSRLALGRIRDSGRPAFVYRDILGIDGPRQFCARNRINGHFTWLRASYGGAVSYGPPKDVHNFYSYVPPDEHFARHPEYFSERDGERRARRAQLCLTNDGLQAFVTGELRRYIAEGERSAAEQGRLPPRLFDISQMDWGGACECPRCRAVAEREGSEAGPLLEFLNEVADSIRDDHPEVRIDTLAYHYTFDPPNTVRPRDNVVIRLSGLQRRDYSESILAPDNRAYREAVERWSEIAPHLRIWDYSVTFGRADLPLPNTAHFPVDLRYYLDLGIEGMFVQHSHPIGADMRDLKLWVLAKLLEDPHREYGELVRDFTKGFYGPAAKPIRRYRKRLAAAARRNPGFLRFRAPPRDYGYLDYPFLARATRLLDRAERRVREDPVLLRRVRHARLSLDRAVLHRLPELLDEYVRSNDPPERFPDVEQVIRRYRETWYAQIDLRTPAARRAAQRERVDRELARILRRLRRGR